MVRRVLAGSLILAGMLLAQLGAFVWWVDREVADADRLGDLAATIVRDDEFRAAVAPEIGARLAAAAPSIVEGTLPDGVLDAVTLDGDVLDSVDLDSVDLDSVDLDQLPVDDLPLGEIGLDEAAIVEAVDSALSDPRIVTAIADTISNAASSVIGRSETEDGGTVHSLDVAPIQAAAAEILTTVDPDLAARVEALATPDPVELDTSRLPDLGAPVAALTLAWMILLGGGVGLALIGVVLHPRPPRALRRVGVFIAVGAGLQLGLAWVTTEIVAPNLPGDGLATAGAVGLRIVLDGWRIQAMTQLVLGGVVAAVGHVLLWIPTPGRRRWLPTG